MNQPRGNKAAVNNRVYVQFDEHIQVFEQRPDFLVFLHAFSTRDTESAVDLIHDLRGYGQESDRSYALRCIDAGIEKERASGCTEEGGKKA